MQVERATVLRLNSLNGTKSENGEIEFLDRREDDLFAEQSCASLDSCFDCQRTTGCHYCADQACHAFGSIYGCFVGISCAVSDQCLRKEPEFIGYITGPGDGGAWGIIGLVLGILVCCYGCFLCCKCCRAKGYADAACGGDDGRHNLRLNLLNRPPESESNNLNEALLEPEEHSFSGAMDPAPYSSINHEPPSVQESLRESGASYRKTLWQRMRHFSYCEVMCLFLTTVVAVTTCVVAVLFWPHAPDFSVCSRDLDMARTLSLFLTRGEVAMQFKLAIYNPNRADVLVHKAEVSVLFEQSVVGKGSMPYVTFPAGTVSDLMFNLDMSPTVGQARRMLSLARKNELFVDIQVAFTGAPRLYLTLPPVSGVLLSPQVNATEQDVRFCRCRDQLVGST
ncbi:MAG: hypothetical protein MHM6MM_001996 [Cercozoa sp. M6MM]